MIIAYSLVIGCSLMHIFCCAIPLLITIIGLGTTVSVTSSEIFNISLFHNFEKFESEILVLSGTILLLALIFKFRTKNLDCCVKEPHNFCSKNEKINNIFLKVSLALYLLNLTTLLVIETTT